MRPRSRKVVRRITCPTCNQQLDVTRAELRVGVAHCVCGAQVALDVDQTGEGPGRAMMVIEGRTLTGGPPSERIIPRATPQPTLLLPNVEGGLDVVVLVVAVAVCVPIALIIPWWCALALVVVLVLGLRPILARLRGGERLEISGETVDHWSDRKVLTRLPVDGLQIATSGLRVMLRGKEGAVEVGRYLRRPEEAAWVAEWLREQTRRP